MTSDNRQAGLYATTKWHGSDKRISESLPNEIEEKRWLDGFLTGFDDGGKSDDGKQTKLF